MTNIGKEKDCQMPDQEVSHTAPRHFSDRQSNLQEKVLMTELTDGQLTKSVLELYSTESTGVVSSDRNSNLL
jgi:hypothetical protein